MPKTWPRGTSNSAVRGSAAQRRARRQWLLSPEAGWGGDGVTVPCYRAATYCGNYGLTVATMQVDRIRPGALGGRYGKDNTRPSCQPCNFETGIELREKIRRGEIMVMALDSDKGNVALWREGKTWTAAAMRGGTVVAEHQDTNRVDALAQLSVSLLELLLTASQPTVVVEENLA